MTNEDIDPPDDFEPEVVEKPSLREVWESNPMLKVAAIVLGGVVALSGYFIFFSGGEEEANKARMTYSDVSQTKIVPGQQELDQSYRQAMEETNKKTAEEAAQTGASALPIPIATSKGGGLDVPAMPERPKSDALTEWRQDAEKNRRKAAADVVEEEAAGPAPEVVPMVQPVRPQQVAKQDPNASKRLAEQMRVILAAQAPSASKDIQITKEDSAYTIMKKEEEQKKRENETARAAAGVTYTSLDSNGKPIQKDKVPTRTIVPAGSIAYAQLLNELNSDIQGPVLAQVLSGPFAGGRIIGAVQVQEEYMVINFNRIIKDAVSYSINGIALDEKTTLAGQATDVDHHYMTRIILPAAAKFIEGYGSALAQTGTTVTTTDGGGQSQETPAPSPKESLYKGLEQASGKLSELMDEGSDRPITVKIAKGTTMGVFFTDTVTTENIER